jgi:hypothetical protein
MAYQHVTAARECRTLRHDLVWKSTTRLVFMTLASAMDLKDNTCRWSLDCIVHYTMLNKKTVVQALNELGEMGIITRHKTGRGNGKFYVWHWDKVNPVRQLYTETEKFADQGQEEEPSENPSKQDVCDHAWSPRGYCYNCNALREDVENAQAAAQEDLAEKCNCGTAGCISTGDGTGPCVCFCHKHKDEDRVDMSAMSAAIEIIED